MDPSDLTLAPQLTQELSERGPDTLKLRYPFPLLIYLGTREIKVASEGPAGKGGFKTHRSGSVATERWPDEPKSLGDTPVLRVVKRSDGAFSTRISVGRTRVSDLQINVSEVSKAHAYFIPNAAGLTLMDADSTNGTFINGRRLYPNSAEPVTSGDTLAFGSFAFAFVSAADLVAYLQSRR